jgi:sarcosine oxidase
VVDVSTEEGSRGGHADVIVVGLGAVGAAAAYQLARRGARVLGIDRFHPPHERGSSHGETRITRQGVGEGAVYGPLALRSHGIWRELESATGRSLLLTCGLLVLGPEKGLAPHHGKTDFVRRSAAAAAEVGVAHELLSAAEIARRYPQLDLRGDEIGYFEPGGGLVYPERCIAAQLDEARRLGAELMLGTRVTAIEPMAQGVRVRAGSEWREADKVVLCAGAWTPGLAGPALGAAVLQPQALHWFAADDPGRYTSERFPTFIWMYGDGAADLFYGFPIAPGAPTPGVKVATEAFAEIGDPDDLARAVSPDRAADVYERHVRGRLSGIGPASLRSTACLYTRTPDADFVIDTHPASERLLVVSACSGHGFKHSAAVGELVAQMALEGAVPPAAFRLARPAMSPASRAL